MKVLMLDPNPVLSYGTDLCNALTDLGVDVVLATTRDYSFSDRARFEVRRLAPGGSPGQYVVKLAQEIAYLSSLSSLVMRWRPDVVHFQWFRVPAELAYLATLWGARQRLVWTVHNVLPHEPRAWDMLYHRILYHLPRRLIAHTEGTKDQLLQLFNVPSSVVAVVPFGNYESVPHEVLPTTTARLRLGLPEDPTIFLFYGLLRPYKGYGELLEAFVRAVAGGCDSVLVIAGRASTTDAARLRGKVRALPDPIRARVHLHVYEDAFLSQELTDELFSAADVVALPYREIWQSAVLFQAFSYAKPVLASAVGGFSETIRDGATGYLVPPGDRDALVRRIDDLSRDRAALKAAGARAQALSQDENSWVHIARLTQRVYQSAQ
jgi:glycosyltransferase involved in cell wall biosynthesis